MLFMEILQEIVIHLSFNMIRTFASFFGHTLSVEVQTNGCLKLQKISEMPLMSDLSLLLFLLQGR